MANSPTVRKRARQAETRRRSNVSARSRMRTSIKNVLKAVARKDKEAAQKGYKTAVPLIDSGVGKGLIHRNKAARHKSKLNHLIRSLG